MADYSTEILALKRAIASGIRTVTHGDNTTTYDTFEKLLARLNWLEAQQSSASRGPLAGYAAFSGGGRNFNGGFL